MYVTSAATVIFRPSGRNDSTKMQRQVAIKNRQKTEYDEERNKQSKKQRNEETTNEFKKSRLIAVYQCLERKRCPTN